MKRVAYVNGAWEPLAQAKISVLDRGFVFGDGIYEVTAVLDGRLVDFDNHMRRLWRCLAEIELAAPVTAEALASLHLDIRDRNNLREGLIYLQVTRGAAERDFAFPKQATPTLVMFTQAKSIVDSPVARRGLKVMSAPDLRWARRDIKSISLLAQVLAEQAAVAAGCDEAWMVEDGLVTEGASSTAFILSASGEIVTRPLSRAILPGVTRMSILALSAATGLPVVERPFSLAEAHSAREAFITSATNFVAPVVEIDGKPVGAGAVGPVATQLRSIYIENARRL